MVSQKSFQALGEYQTFLCGLRPPRDRFLGAIENIAQGTAEDAISRKFGLLSDCMSAARCVSKCRGHDFGSHAAVELLPGT